MAHELFIELNEEESVISIDEVSEAIKSAETLPEGKLWAGRDGGARPWWHRLFGTQKRYVDSLFSLEWCSDAASLIFHDRDWNEYRALKPIDAPSFSEEIRLKISHGEVKPVDENECINKDLAFKAISELVDSGIRPNWLQYKFVG